jgi:hypothetical protein
MLDQNELFRARARLVPRPAARRDHRPGDAALAERVDNTSGAPNENYAREMMELFTLGADRGAYTEDDVREQARALTGWRNDWVDELGATTSATTRSATTTATRPSSARPATSTGRTPCRLVRRAPAPRVVLRDEAVELLRPDAADAPHAGALQRSTSLGLRRSARWSRRS